MVADATSRTASNYARIAGTGSYLPERELTNKDIDAFLARANEVKAQLQEELELVEKEIAKGKK